MNQTKATGIAILLASITLLLAVIIMPIVYMNGKHDETTAKTILELMGKGVDPISARCALAEAQDQLCVLYVATKKEK